MEPVFPAEFARTPYERTEVVDLTVAKRVLETVDAGLCHGIGDPIPGQMCVEAAVCYAMGLDHSDQPPCVENAVRDLKIDLNDSSLWLSRTSRAKGLRRLAIAQLGSAGVVNPEEFSAKVTELFMKTVAAEAVKADMANAESKEAKAAYQQVLDHCLSGKCYSDYAKVHDILTSEFDVHYELTDILVNPTGIMNELYAATEIILDALASGDYWTKREAILAEFCEGVVQVLIELKSPGTEFLYLTE